MSRSAVTLADIAQFDELIDVRSPAEFREDHLPGALNSPVLFDEQRALVGTLYKQQSPFEARRLGGALVAENIAIHLKETFHDRPKSWRPLLYCWRGGMRSGSFVTWMRLVGWQACQLEGGYKTWRHHVVDGLGELGRRLQFCVICGATGSGKTLLLSALRQQGAQVLDLEALAIHRGSVLGAIPGHAQPPQKWFETQVYACLRNMDPERPVFIEAESRKIGALYVPEPLVMAMRASSCLELNVARQARLRYLLEDYASLGDKPEELVQKLDFLKGIVDNDTLTRWKRCAQGRDLTTLYSELIAQHYDPLYLRSQNRNFTQFPHAARFYCDDLSPQRLAQLASEILSQDRTATQPKTNDDEPA